MHSNGHHLEVTAEEFTQDILDRHATTGPRYRRVMWVTGLLFLVGIAGFVLRVVTSGFDEREPWGYFAATVAFLLSTAGAAPVVAVALRLVKAHWRRPLTRIAEMYAVVGGLSLLMFIPLLFLVPSAAGRRTLWFQDMDPPTLGLQSSWIIPGAPHVWVTLQIAVFMVVGLALLWLSSRPDMAIMRERVSGRLASWGSRMSKGWLGTQKQWTVLQVGVGAVGALFFIMLVGTITLFCIDFGMTLVPGWRDSIFAAQQSINALQGGLATTVLTLWLVRRYGKLEQYIHMEHFWGASKILLALTLLWFYFWWSAFIVFWYGRQPAEQAILDLLMFGPYRYVFILAFVFCFVAPFFTLLWNGVRRSTWGPPLAAALILIGTLLDKIRLYVASYSVPNAEITAHLLEKVPPPNYPDIIDLMMMVGGISGAMFIVLMAARVIPIFSLWEMTEGIRLRAVRPFLRTKMVVLGKPD